MYILKEIGVEIMLRNINKETLKEQYPWFFERDKEMVIHNDLDGILTGMFLSHYMGWKVVGVYDLETIHISKDFKGRMEDIIYVDLDVTFKDYKSLGHHIIGTESANHLNLNTLFGIDHRKYVRKYPLSTVFFLYWLYDIALPTDAEQLSFLLHGDSVLANYSKYTDNVSMWLKHLNFEHIIYRIECGEIEEITKQKVLPMTYGWNKQCTYLIKDGVPVFKESKADFQTYINRLCRIFKFEPMVVPTNLTRSKKFNRLEYEIPKGQSFPAVLQKIKGEHEVFSYSMKFLNKLDFTTFAV